MIDDELLDSILEERRSVGAVDKTGETKVANEIGNEMKNELEKEYEESVNDRNRDAPNKIKKEADAADADNAADEGGELWKCVLLFFLGFFQLKSVLIDVNLWIDL